MATTTAELADALRTINTTQNHASKAISHRWLHPDELSNTFGGIGSAARTLGRAVATTTAGDTRLIASYGASADRHLTTAADALFALETLTTAHLTHCPTRAHLKKARTALTTAEHHLARRPHLTGIATALTNLRLATTDAVKTLTKHAPARTKGLITRHTRIATAALTGGATAVQDAANHQHRRL